MCYIRYSMKWLSLSSHRIIFCTFRNRMLFNVTITRSLFFFHLKCKLFCCLFFRLALFLFDIFTWQWKWLPLRLSKRQSMSSQTVLHKTTHTWTITRDLITIPNVIVRFFYTLIKEIHNMFHFYHYKRQAKQTEPGVLTVENIKSQDHLGS